LEFSAVKAKSSNYQPPGYSLVEMTLVISLLGILATIAVISLTGVVDRTKEVGGKERAEWLNRALQTYIQVNGDFFQTPSPGAADETIVLRTMQWGDPTKPAKPGQPYVTLNYNPVSSSDSKKIRLQWTGSAYKVLGIGATGTGLLVPLDGSDMTTPLPIPATFRPAGR
jgi:prepilin-type N-terminal cleavage/methylation domain-containing protein